jgi:glycosyltransferase involved in cell wall biosynthesis
MYTQSLMTTNVKFFVLDITLRGGVERFVSNLSQLLQKDGCEVVIYSFHKTHLHPLYAISPNVTIVYLTQYKFRPFIYKLVTLWCCFKIRRLLSSYSKPFFGISTHPITTISLFFLFRKILPKTIASEHSTYLAHNKFIRSMRLLAYKDVRYVVTQTMDGVHRFAEAGITAKRISNPTTDFNDKRQWSTDVDIGTRDEFVCLSISRFEHVKQLDHYIETARIVHESAPDIRFFLVGSGPLESYLSGLVTKYSLSEVFSILPPTPHVNQYYRSADVYVVTSSSEAFPMTVLEALSFGVPVISYDKLVGPGEIITDHVNGYLVGQDRPEEIAKRIVDLYFDRELRLAMRRNAVKSSLQFSPEKVSIEWANLL